MRRQSENATLDLLETHLASKLMAFTSMWVTAPDGWTGKMEISF
ncbi:hypothetical protein X734_21615 [Mesorhizobium sp. L2C084A000]|nr:hypothetical protein X734_21615 [Mesorhizobium sp. L2C084A000]